jgi:hypothetical protein
MRASLPVQSHIDHKAGRHRKEQHDAKYANQLSPIVQPIDQRYIGRLPLRFRIRTMHKQIGNHRNDKQHVNDEPYDCPEQATTSGLEQL